MAEGRLSLQDSDRATRRAGGESAQKSASEGPQQSGAAKAQSSELQQALAPDITYAVPKVVNVARVTDPVQRNQQINQSYNAIDTAMSAYLGQPLVSNWCTYGQHASREAGTQINNLKAGLIVLEDCLSMLESATKVYSSPLAAYNAAKKVVPTIRRVLALLNQGGLIQQSLQLGLAKAGVTAKDLRAAADAVDDATSFQWSDLIPGKALIEQGKVAYHALSIAGKLTLAIPSIIASVRKVYRNMVKGNREIYENVAPAFVAFLQAGLQAPQGIVGPMAFAGDDSGFLAAAMGKYSEVRKLANQIAVQQEDSSDSGPSSKGFYVEQRNAIAHEANLLIGYQEQLVILQPIFDTMQEELAAMSGTMVLNDPNGVHPLIGNWGDFYTRMGIDSSRAPKDPTSVTPDNLPPMRGSKDPKYKGSIGDYFESGLTDKRIHNRPKNIRNH